MSETSERVVVVAGGGYSGVLAANRLSGKLRGQARVILVAPGNGLTDRIRLHEVAARGGDVRRSYAKILADGVEHIDARALGLERAASRIAIERGAGTDWLHYDALVLALGSRLSPAIPSTAPHALALASVERAQQLSAALERLSAGERVAIVGGGLTAIELSAEIAEAHPRLEVQLIASELVPDLAGPARESLRAGLAALGVQIRVGVAVIGVGADAVQLADGTSIEAAISVLAAGFRAAPLPESFGLPSRADGRIDVDAELRIEGAANLFVAGDLAAPPSASIGSGLQTTRMACATAMPLGAHAADQVARLFAGKPLAAYHFGYTVRCISLGRKNGVVVSVDADDRPTGRVITGRPAALIKECICRFVIAALRLERMLSGSFIWPSARRASAVRLA